MTQEIKAGTQCGAAVADSAAALGAGAPDVIALQKELASLKAQTRQQADELEELHRQNRVLDNKYLDLRQENERLVQTIGQNAQKTRKNIKLQNDQQELSLETEYRDFIKSLIDNGQIKEQPAFMKKSGVTPEMQEHAGDLFRKLLSMIMHYKWMAREIFASSTSEHAARSSAKPNTGSAAAGSKDGQPAVSSAADNSGSSQNAEGDQSAEGNPDNQEHNGAEPSPEQPNPEPNPEPSPQPVPPAKPKSPLEKALEQLEKLNQKIEKAKQRLQKASDDSERSFGAVVRQTQSAAAKNEKVNDISLKIEELQAKREELIAKINKEQPETVGISNETNGISNETAQPQGGAGEQAAAEPSIQCSEQVMSVLQQADLYGGHDEHKQPSPSATGNGTGACGSAANAVADADAPDDASGEAGPKKQTHRNRGNKCRNGLPEQQLLVTPEVDKDDLLTIRFDGEVISKKCKSAQDRYVQIKNALNGVTESITAVNRSIENNDGNLLEVNSASTTAVMLADKHFNPVLKLNSAPHTSAAGRKNTLKRSPLLPRESKKRKAEKAALNVHHYPQSVIDLMVPHNSRLYLSPRRFSELTCASEIYGKRPAYVGSQISQGTVIEFMVQHAVGTMPKNRVLTMFNLSSNPELKFNKKSLFNHCKNYSRDFLHWVAELMRKEVITHNKVVCIDETRYMVIEAIKAGLSKIYGQIWVVASGPNEKIKRRVYFYSPDRSAETLFEIFADFLDTEEGRKAAPSILEFIICDHHCSYDKAREVLKAINSNLRLARCWQHFCRRIINFLRSAGLFAVYNEIKRKCSKQSTYQDMVHLIEEKFAEMAESSGGEVNRIALGMTLMYHYCRALFRLDRAALDTKRRKKERRESRRQQEVLVNEIARLCRELIKLDPYTKVTENEDGTYSCKNAVKGTWAEALSYFLNIESDLRTFLSDLNVCASNNLAELAIRNFTITRKNSLFSQTIDGIMALCDIKTIVESCMMNNIDPRAYLSWLVQMVKMRLEEHRLDSGNPYQNCLPRKTDKLGPEEIEQFMKDHNCREHLARAEVYRPDSRTDFDDLEYIDLGLSTYLYLLEHFDVPKKPKTKRRKRKT